MRAHVHVCVENECVLISIKAPLIRPLWLLIVTPCVGKDWACQVNRLEMSWRGEGRSILARSPT